MKSYQFSNYQFITFILFSLSILCAACQSNQETSKKEVEKEDIAVVTTPKFDRLDKMDLKAMKKTFTKYTEAGDCENQITRYEKDGLILVIDSLACGEYYSKFTHYLLNKKRDIEMVHVKYIEPFYEEKKEEFFYALSEHLIDFTDPDAPVMMGVVDTLKQVSPEALIAFDKNYQSDAWISITAKGDDFVLGKKIDYSGNWYEDTKRMVKDSLVRMETIPQQIPVEFLGEVLMGMRGEFRSLTEEAVEEVASERSYEFRQKIDYFARIKKPFQKMEKPEEQLTMVFWKKEYARMGEE